MNTDQKKFLDQLYKVNQQYQQETLYNLLSLYHKFLHDTLTLEDFQEIASRHGIDIFKEYDIVMERVEDSIDPEDMWDN